MVLGVLCSGGLDSAILVGDFLHKGATVQPIYIRCGLSWEAVELTYLLGFLNALKRPTLQPLVILDQPIRDVYGDHWSITGRNVPDAATPDEAVFLPGRNVLLLAKALLWCYLHQVPELALGVLTSNPFPDASPLFFQRMEDVVNQAIEGHVRIKLPLSGMKKAAVMRLVPGLPLEHTFSCIHPRSGLHCGQCNKCAERKLAFADADLTDPTEYFE